MRPNSLLRTDGEFASIYERNIKRVYQICYLYLKSHHDAEDAAQAIFEKFLNQNRCFHDNDHEKAWFICVSKNYCRDELKKFWKKNRVDIQKVDGLPAVIEADDCVLMDALLNLPPKYKAALYLHYVEGYSVREMSQLLHRNESTLRNHLSAGRAMLKIDMGGYYEK